MSEETTDAQSLELRRQAAIGRLLAGVAHELSAPLASILSNRDVESRLLDRMEQAAGGDGPGSVTELVAACREIASVDRMAGERIGRLVRSLKTAARAADSKPQRVQINQIVESALELAKTEFKSRIAVETDFAELPDVECFPHLMSQAILNLVTNAGQAIEGAGTITASTRLEGDSVHIRITDTGSGFAPELRGKVMQQGFTTKPLGVGTGLGLLIVRRIVRDIHGGAVDFENESGRGTTFHVRIPLEQNLKGVEPIA